MFVESITPLPTHRARANRKYKKAYLRYVNQPLSRIHSGYGTELPILNTQDLKSGGWGDEHHKSAAAA